MMSLPNEKKWQLYCSQKGIGLETRSGSSSTGLSNDPETYIEKVSSLALLPFSANPEDVRARTRCMDSLQIALRTQPNSFVTSFIEADGLNSLLDYLAVMDYDTLQSPIHTVLLGCLKALMNNSVRTHSMTHSVPFDLMPLFDCRLVGPMSLHIQPG